MSWEIQHIFTAQILCHASFSGISHRTTPNFVRYGYYICRRCSPSFC